MLCKYLYFFKGGLVQIITTINQNSLHNSSIHIPDDQNEKEIIVKNENKISRKKIKKKGDFCISSIQLLLLLKTYMLSNMI